MPTKVWVAGEEVLSADFNPMVQEQVVATFPTAAARATALPAPKAGMCTWLNDAKVIEVFDGTAWVPVGSRALRPAYVPFNTGRITVTTEIELGNVVMPAVPYVSLLQMELVFDAVVGAGGETDGRYYVRSYNGATLLAAHGMLQAIALPRTEKTRDLLQNIPANTATTARSAVQLPGGFQSVTLVGTFAVTRYPQ